MPARPPAPFKPLRMNVSRHYYIKNKKQEKLLPYPTPRKKKMCDQQKLNKKGQKRAPRDSIDLWPGGADISWPLIRDEYEVQKFSWVDLLCFEKTMQLHSFTPISVQYAVFSQRFPSQYCFSKNAR
jgi:hypothetical protein